MTSQKATFAAGCFWGVEAEFRMVPGVLATQVGYTGGMTSHPTYEEVCSHTTGHAEAVEVEFDPERVSYDELVERFWKLHNPTQVNRQGWDIGDQYRSAIFTHGEEQLQVAEASKARAQGEFRKPIATQIVPASTFYRAEDYHQQYLERNPGGYCPVHATGVKLNEPVEQMEQV